MDNFLQKNTFIERLCLPSDIEKEILEYHLKEASLPIDLGCNNGTYIQGLLDTYSKLLLIARTPYFSKDEAKNNKLTNVHYEWITDYDFRHYFVGYKPAGISIDAWFSFCDASADCGFLRPFGGRESLSLKWAEIDHVFKTLANYYAIEAVAYAGDPFVIGCFNPCNHSNYEAFDRILGVDDLDRLLRYLSIVSPDAAEGINRLIYGDYPSGDFENWIMADSTKRQLFSRAEVIANVNRIYLGRKVIIEI